jgi:hypothetical protein
MTEKEMCRLYSLLEKLTDENDKAALKHALFILELNALINE